MGKPKWVTKSVSFSCQDLLNFTKSVSFSSAFRDTRFRLPVSGPLKTVRPILTLIISGLRSQGLNLRKHRRLLSALEDFCETYETSASTTSANVVFPWMLDWDSNVRNAVRSRELFLEGVMSSGRLWEVPRGFTSHFRASDRQLGGGTAPRSLREIDQMISWVWS